MGFDPVSIISGVVGPVIGLVGNYLNKKQEIEAKKLDYGHDLEVFKHEVEMQAQARITAHEANEEQMSLNRQVTDADLAKTVITGEYAGLNASIAADAKQDGGPFWNAVRTSVRPVLTYGLTIATIFIGFLAVTADIKAAAFNTVLTNTGMAIAWWYGARPTNLVKSSYLK